MRQLWFAWAIVFSCVCGDAFGQPSKSAPRPDDRLIDKLREHGIQVFLNDADLKQQGYRASVNVTDAETVKAMDLLVQIKDLSAISVSLGDSKYTRDALKSIERLPHIKKLGVSGPENR